MIDAKKLMEMIELAEYMNMVGKEVTDAYSRCGKNPSDDETFELGLAYVAFEAVQRRYYDMLTTHYNQGA